MITHTNKNGGTFKVICISSYPSDLKKLDSIVETLAKLGAKKPSRSSLVRYLVSRLTDDDVLQIAEHFKQRDI